jgi:hypothetical protein
MKPVGADDEIEAPFTAMLEFDMHLAVHLAQTGDAVPEDGDCLTKPLPPIALDANLNGTLAPTGT